MTMAKSASTCERSLLNSRIEQRQYRRPVRSAGAGALLRWRCGGARPDKAQRYVDEWWAQWTYVKNSAMPDVLNYGINAQNVQAANRRIIGHDDSRWQAGESITQAALAPPGTGTGYPAQVIQRGGPIRSGHRRCGQVRGRCGRCRRRLIPSRPVVRRVRRAR